jgi:hypothetical protein
MNLFPEVYFGDIPHIARDIKHNPMILLQNSPRLPHLSGNFEASMLAKSPLYNLGWHGGC